MTHKVKIEAGDFFLQDEFKRRRRRPILTFTKNVKNFFRFLTWNAALRSAFLIKRFLDIFASLVGLVILTPVLLLVAILIKVESPGPVFFKQERVGKWGRKFYIYKFRSMFLNSEALRSSLSLENEMVGGLIFKMRNDPRITRVGRFIRRSSIDELPQLINVLKGEMSLVGPRPALQSEVDLYSLSDRRRLMMVPGITCLWQINGRSEIPFEEQVKLDLAYMESKSFWEDIKILSKTIPAVISGRGAF